MQNSTFPARVYLLAAAFALMTVGYAVARLAGAAAYQDPYPFRVQQQRLAGIRALLAEEPQVGYLTNIPMGTGEFVRLYFPTQYTLAPTLLVPLEFKPEVRWVVGNFTRQQDYRAAGEAHGLTVEREFPMGVVLYRTRAASTAGAPRP